MDCIARPQASAKRIALTTGLLGLADPATCCASFGRPTPWTRSPGSARSYEQARLANAQKQRQPRVGPRQRCQAAGKSRSSLNPMRARSERVAMRSGVAQLLDPPSILGFELEGAVIDVEVVREAIREG